MTASSACRPLVRPDRTRRDRASASLTVAALTAALGGVLAGQAGWQGRYVLAGWLAYAVLGCIVAVALEPRARSAPASVSPTR